MLRINKEAMEDGNILLSQLNDFIFCPASIYFHNLYGTMDTRMFQRTDQINGTSAHQSIDQGSYSTRKNILTALDVYSEEYGLIGKVDVFDCDKGELVERKKRIKTIYDGYILQLYGQYYCLTEMGYKVKQLFLYSMDDNKRYRVPLPEEDEVMKGLFDRMIAEMRAFELDGFAQTNREKCAGCVYEPACDRGLI